MCCDICRGDHRAANCELRDKCLRCRRVGHFARDCHNPPWDAPEDLPMDPELAATDPTPAEAAQGAASSTGMSVDVRDNQLDEMATPHLSSSPLEALAVQEGDDLPAYSESLDETLANIRLENEIAHFNASTEENDYSIDSTDNSTESNVNEVNNNVRNMNSEGSEVNSNVSKVKIVEINTNSNKSNVNSNVSEPGTGHTLEHGPSVPCTAQSAWNTLVDNKSANSQNSPGANVIK